MSGFFMFDPEVYTINQEGRVLLHEITADKPRLHEITADKNLPGGSDREGTRYSRGENGIRRRYC